MTQPPDSPPERVYVTNPAAPSEGRVFIWHRTRWYERVAGEDGPAAFTPLADSDEELPDAVPEAREGSFVEIEDDFAARVHEEFREHTPLYPEAPELSDQER